CFIYFFFSSRRRHTRFSRDWSSDVCSSDLYARRRFEPMRLSPSPRQFLRKAPLRSAHWMEVLRKSAVLRLAEYSLTPLRFASLRLAPLRSAQLMSARFASTESRSASLRLAPDRFACRKSAPVRFAPSKLASSRSAHCRLA